MKNYKSILIIATQEIGDVILVTPLIRSLRYSYPDATIDVLLYSGTEEALESNLDVNKIIKVKRSPKLAEFLKTSATIFRKYHISFITQSGDRPYIYGLIASWRRVGIIDKNKKSWILKKFLCYKSVTIDLNYHTIYQNLILAEKLGIYPITIVSPPTKPLTKFAEDNLAYPFCVLHISARCTYKDWSLEKWKKLIERIIKSGYNIYLTGKGEREFIICNNLVELFGDSAIFNVVGKFSLGEVSSLILRSHFYVGPDTSVTHITASLGVPTIALYGPSNPMKWGPWPARLNGQIIKSPYRMNGSPWQEAGNVILLQSSFSCVPCLNEGCEKKVTSISRCLYEIDHHSVISAINAIKRLGCVIN